MNGFDYMMRAHQFFSFGVNISKGGKVITLFSSSNYCDTESCAGCALVGSDHKIQLLMKEHSANKDDPKSKSKKSQNPPTGRHIADVKERQ